MAAVSSGYRVGIGQAPGHAFYGLAHRSHRMRSRPTRGGCSLKVLALGNRSVTLEKSVWLAKIGLNQYLIIDYPQPFTHGTEQEHMAVSAGLDDGAQQGSVSKGPQ
jgi:hypothetical protein